MERILRPLNYGDLFDEMFDLYKKNFLLFMGIVSLTYIPTFAIQVVLPGIVHGSVDATTGRANPAAQSPTAMFGQFVPMIKVGAPAGIVAWLLQIGDDRRSDHRRFILLLGRATDYSRIV